MKKICIIQFMIFCLFITGCSDKSLTDTYDENMQLAGSHAVYIDEDGTLKGFGDSSLGQLGDIYDEYIENAISVTNDVKSVHSKGFSTAVIKNDNSLWICGYNQESPFEDDTHTKTMTTNTNDSKIRKNFVKVLENVKTVDIGYCHTVAILTDGSLYAWGNNEYGQLGNGNNVSLDTPVKIGEDFTDVSVSFASTYALKKDGTLWSCGLNDSGQLGIGNIENSNVLIKIMDDVKSVYADFYTCAAIKKDNSLWIWGSSDGASWNDASYSAIPVKRMENIEKISLGLAFNVVKKTDGGIWGWGNNVYGQLIPDSTMLIIPEPIALSGDILDFDCNIDSVMIKKNDGTIAIQGNFQQNTTLPEKEYIPYLSVLEQ
ncbi:MAG: hypothetical protein J6A69_03775 [Clostridia bacterium]|nr:hypothetical protein [Clostridia bacterium]